MNDEKLTLFDNPKTWEDEWQSMPEYNNKEIKAEITATFKFKSEDDFNKFKDIIKKELFNNEKPFDGRQSKNIYSTWWPQNVKARNYRYDDES